MTTTRSMSAPAHHPMPFTRLELVVLRVVESGLQVMLARRAQAPYAGRWALPGGALRIDLDRSLEAAARRVMLERLGIAHPHLRQSCAVGGPSRDPRAPWALSVIYRALVPVDEPEPAAGKRIEALAWRAVDDAMSDRALAFDHATLIREAVAATRAEVDGLQLPFEMLPQAFTLGELQALCERILGRRLDKSSFRRRLAERDLVDAVVGAMRGGAFRPAQLYRAKA